MIRVRDVQHDRIHCKGVELALKNHERMIRYTFRVPPKVGEHGKRLNDAEWLDKCSRYIQKWMDLIVAQKKRQMHLPDDMWPPWPPRSSVSDVYTMPMVMWLSKAPKEKKPPPPPPAYNCWDNRYMPRGFVAGRRGDSSC